jgi:dethiobiotin synthetase
MSVRFIAGAHTDVGKTYCSVLMLRDALRVGRIAAGLKPVASGVSDWNTPAFLASDTAKLLEAQGWPVIEQTVDSCTPWRFKAPLSPDMAAAAEGRTLKLAEVAAWAKARVAPANDADILIEGAGGVMSPLCEDGTNLDLMAALGAPVILVAGTYLGSISHTLTAVEAMRARGLTLHALLVNESVNSAASPAQTIESLQRFLPGVRMLPIPRSGTPPRLAGLFDD